MVDNPWQVDPKDEPKFWNGIKKKLIHVEQQVADPQLISAGINAMTREVVERYAFEIASDFRYGVYHFAKQFCLILFLLINASAGKTMQAVVNHSVKLQERVHLMGHVEHLRKLGKRGHNSRPNAYQQR